MINQLHHIFKDSERVTGDSRKLTYYRAMQMSLHYGYVDDTHVRLLLRNRGLVESDSTLRFFIEDKLLLPYTGVRR